MADRDTRAGIRKAGAELLSYVDSLHAAHDEALKRAFDTPERLGMPAIQVGPAEGKLIRMLIELHGARRVVEIGTLAGYSAIHIARALGEDGRLWTIEIEPSHAKIARDNISAAGLSERVTVVEGRAADVLPMLERWGPFDVVFLDADKASYDTYGRWAARHLRPRGMLLADNAYYFGELLSEEDPAARAMRRFHEESRANFETTCIPTPDGLLFGIRR